MTSHLCARCGFRNLSTDQQCYKCKAALNSTRSDFQAHSHFPTQNYERGSVWRKNTVLIMTRKALLPDRCIKCNEPAERKLKRKLSWHHPALYILIFGGALFYVLLAMVLRKTATIEVGLCEEHSAVRRCDIIITWILGLLSMGSFFLALQLEELTFVGIGSLLMLATAVYGIVRVKVVTPTKIDETFLWLKGFNSNYLADFPEWHSSN